MNLFTKSYPRTRRFRAFRGHRSVLFGVFGGLISAGVSGWAVGYCCTKFVAELFVVCIPLIAHQAHAEESAALAQPDAKAARR